MADVQPFRAELYAEAVAGPLDRLVAPPYDVIGPELRAELRTRSPYNVVRLTLPESAEEAAATLAAWREEEALVRDAEPCFWVLVQDYVGPDGVARTRTGLVGSLRVEPYERGVVLPHERTHREVKEERLRLLRATRTQLEPIFLLYEGDPAVTVPGRPPDLEVAGARLWRFPAADLGERLDGVRLLIADGHHRYETAVAFAAEDGRPGSERMPVVMVSSADPGLTIFPTHRLVRGLPALPGETGEELDAALERLAAAPSGSAAAVLYRGGEAWLVSSGDLALDSELVTGEIVEYTPDRERAVAAVDRGEAEAAFLLRAPRVEDVFAVAARGGVMPPKSTYFFPKLLSGLLFHPLDAPAA